jgi:N-acetyl-anhydromuramyl-L-alanine amidase AmpD
MLTLLLALQLAILHPKPFSHYGPRETAHSYIVVHSTESCGSPASVLSYLRSTKKSYHYLVERDGTTVQMVDPYWQGKHAGLSVYKGMVHWNRFSIGISFHQCKDQPFTDKQYRSGRLLVEYLEKKYPDINSTRIVTHHQISLFRGKKDPGPLFDMSRILPP